MTVTSSAAGWPAGPGTLTRPAAACWPFTAARCPCRSPTPRDTTSSQRGAQLPQQREEAKVTTPPQIRPPRRSAGAWLVADLPFHNRRVQRTPLRRQLVVGEQPFRDIPEVAVRRPVARHRDQRAADFVLVARRQPARRERREQAVLEARLVESALQSSPLLVG